MPDLPLPRTNPEELEKNVKRQYEALGRFVEAFELMIDEVRGACIDRIWDAVTSDAASDYGADRSYRKGLIEISFHQQNMTAKPLWDTMRAIIAEIVGREGSPHHADYNRFKSLLGFMEKEYSFLFWKRNELLHGTWLIGYASNEDPHAEKFRIRKFKTTADGLQVVEQLPQDVSELSSLTIRCDRMRSWIAEVDWCLRKTKPLSDFFKLEGKRWFHRFLASSEEWTTLSGK
ncbi:MAG: hypothetical protein P4M07_23640 [Xanthobacteraceae bacterium]|nr:hypothetical protein [Xanthobacteraceae bacterium]